MFLIHSVFITRLMYGLNYTVWNSDTLSISEMTGREIVRQFENGAVFENLIKHDEKAYTISYIGGAVHKCYKNGIWHIGDVNCYVDDSYTKSSVIVTYKDSIYKVVSNKPIAYIKYLPVLENNELRMVSLYDLNTKDVELHKLDIDMNKFKRLLLLGKDELFK